MTAALTNATLDTLQALERAPSVLKVKEVFRRSIEKYGLTSFLCSAPPRVHDEYTNPVLFEEWPHGWGLRYAHRRYYLRDPMLQELYRTAEPYAWSDVLARGTYSSTDCAIVYDASAWGMREGFVIPIYGVGGQVHAVTMGGLAPRIDRHARAELHLTSIYAYARAKQLRRPRGDSPPTLRPRERDALQWVAAGKSDWEIGQILGISESAAHKHVESAKRKMGVPTRVQAVVEAIRSGQIHL
jgi:LuxR family quorum sensing-dependent transcriptional regulator